MNHALDEMKNNVQVVNAVVTNCGPALEFVSIELKNNKQIMTAAVINYGYALKVASNELRNNV